MYTIFKNDCVFYLTDNKDFSLNSHFISWDSFDLTENLNKCDSSNPLTFYLYHSDLEFLWKEFKKKFKIIEAAGGVVLNHKKEILFIYRLDKWDLPKGKVEKGESLQETAVREVQEECGISDLTLKNFISTTYHIYEEKGKQILKVSHWYAMHSETEEFIPQLEEDITKVEWKDSKGIKKAIENTYPNIKLLIKSVIS